MLALSLFFQLAFLAGSPVLSYLLEALLLGFCIKSLVDNRMELKSLWTILRRFTARQPIVTSLVGVAWSYLAGLALLIPPSNPDSLRYHLTRVLLFQQENTFFLNVPDNNQATLAVFPVGGDVLAHLFLRFDTDYGVGVFALLSYFAVVFGAYALACRHASPPIAVVAALAIASLPELVYLATSGKNDIVLAATAIFCLVTAFRLRDQPAPLDLLLLCLGVAFGISVKTLFLGFALPFAVLFGVCVLSRHGIGIFWRFATSNPTYILAMVLPVATLAQTWLFIYNYRELGDWSGPPGLTDHARNQDGLTGTVANMTRYAFESIDLLKVGDMAVERLTGTFASEALESAYNRFCYPLWGDAGSDSPFTIKMSINETKAWFGPLGFLLILPSLVYGLWRGPRELRMVVLVLGSYFLIVSWQIAWTMWHGRYFAVVFAGAAPCLAAFLMSWERQQWRLRLIRSGSLLLMLYACVLNELKPLVPLTLDPRIFIGQLLHDNVWVKTNWGRQRFYFYGDLSALEVFAEKISPGDRVGILPRDNASLYFYPRRRPDVRFRVLPASAAEDGVISSNDARGLDWILCIGLEACRSLTVDGTESPGVCRDVDGRFNDYCLYAVASIPTSL